MPEIEMLSGTFDMYDEFDCEVEEGAKITCFVEGRREANIFLSAVRPYQSV